MKRQRRTPGSIVKIELGDGVFSYAQILDKQLVFFDLKTRKDIDLDILGDANVLFYLSVYKFVITKGRWEIIGRIDINERHQIVPMQFIQDKMKPNTFEIYNPNTGEISSSSYDECKDLECCATWEAEHVEDRLRDHFNDVPNKWVQSLAPRISC